MMHSVQWLQPGYLLLAPLSWLLLWALYRQQLQPRWQQQLPASFQRWLVVKAHNSQQGLPFVLLALAALLAALALAGPRWQQNSNTLEEPLPAPLVMVVELTPELLATDLPPSRLHLVRAKLANLLQLQQPGPAAIVLYAGSAHVLMPLSSDPEIGLNMLEALSPEIMPLPGHAAGQGLALATELLQRNSQSAGRIVLLTHSLATAEQQAIKQLLKDSPHSLHILGVGSLSGAPSLDPETGLIQSGSPLNQLQEQQLKDFARSLNAGYARITADHSDLQQAGLLVRDASGQQRLVAATAPGHQGHWLLLPLLLLLAPLARRGWLAGLLACCLLPVHDSWAEALPSLQHPLAEQIATDPQQALDQLEDPFWLAVAAYQAGQYEQAAEGFASLNTAVARYNLGNSLMQLGRFNEAREAYLAALQIWPTQPQLQHNLALSEQLLLQEKPAPNTNPASLQSNLSLEPSDAEPHKTARIDTTVKAPDNPDTWLQQIPDHPGELLRQRFWNEQFRKAN